MTDVLAIARADIVGKWGRLRQVARDSGIAVSTLRRMVTHPDPNATQHNLEKLAAYYAKQADAKAGGKVRERRAA